MLRAYWPRARGALDRSPVSGCVGSKRMGPVARLGRSARRMEPHSSPWCASPLPHQPRRMVKKFLSIHAAPWPARSWLEARGHVDGHEVSLAAIRSTSFQDAGAPPSYMSLHARTLRDAPGAVATSCRWWAPAVLGAIVLGLWQFQRFEHARSGRGRPAPSVRSAQPIRVPTATPDPPIRAVARSRGNCERDAREDAARA